jgi:hypothetical protein
MGIAIEAVDPHTTKIAVGILSLVVPSAKNANFRAGADKARALIPKVDTRRASGTTGLCLVRCGREPFAVETILSLDPDRTTHILSLAGLTEDVSGLT